MLTLRHGLVPACLTLAALLWAAPLLADTPAVPAAQASTPQLIRLQHIVPGNIVKLMHWEAVSNLPAGVARVLPVPVQNALLVTATPAGLAQVRQIVAAVDVEYRQVLIKLEIAHASAADLEASEIEFDSVPLAASDPKQGFIRYASNPAAAALLQTLRSKEAVTEAPDITTTENVAATVVLSATGLPTVSQQIRVVPRVNSDSSVTLDLHAAFSEGAGVREVNTLRTIKSSDTLLLVMPPASAGDKNLLLFVTPTLK